MSRGPPTHTLFKFHTNPQYSNHQLPRPAPTPPKSQHEKKEKEGKHEGEDNRSEIDYSNVPTSLPPLSLPHFYSMRQANSAPETSSPPPDQSLQASTSATSAGSLNDNLSLDEIVRILTAMEPSNVKEYAEHVHKLAAMLDDPTGLSTAQVASLSGKYFLLLSHLDRFVKSDDPLHSRIYLVVERNFDLLVRMAINHSNMDVSTRTIRFLTHLMMVLNYWEIYNLLAWKPAIYHFLVVIRFDFIDCYKRFLQDYETFNYNRVHQPNTLARRVRARTRARRALAAARKKGRTDPYTESDIIRQSLSAKERRRLRQQGVLVSHKVVKRTSPNASFQEDDKDDKQTKSSNYDPDVVHECQLPSPDEPRKMCMRRFSRKYELIRHQETVHSKKKKLFKCFVCVKQNPQVGPRIFTRHDTLAKHIRVNHKISGKEAKQEVAYSKKNAEIVDEGDITVHVGRRKTKVDFELRAHMEKKRAEKGEEEYSEGDDEYEEEVVIRRRPEDSEQQ